MEIYGLVGWPLGHSFSRAFFTAKFEKEGLDAEYRNFEMEATDSLRQLAEGMPMLRGLNVTIPHKGHVMPLLDELQEEARAIGAVNVIRVRHTADGRVWLKGYNSDVIGFSDSLRPLLEEYHNKALVLGTGGASKAVVYGLRKMGITPTYVSRHADSGEGSDIQRITYADLTPQMMDENKLIVNCSPVGMYPHTEEAPAIPYELLTPRHLLYDLVYNPEETLFLKKGAEQGCKCKNGLEMLHLQALASWRFWHEE